MNLRVRSRLIVFAAFVPLAVVLGTTLASRPAQAPPDTATRSRSAPDLRRDECVLVLPGMDRVRVRKDVTFAPGLELDLYLPPRPTRNPPPVVVFVNGAGDREIPVREWGIYRSWAQLAALQGMAAVVHDTRIGHELEDASAALAHVHAAAKDLGIDGDNVLVWSCSANVRAGWPLATDPSNTFVKAAVVYYGNPDTTLRRHDLPILVGRAGLDNAFTNGAIDRTAWRALQVNAPLTVMNVANGRHAFDLIDDDDQSRAAVRATLDWMAAQLSPGVQVARGLRAEEKTARRLVREGAWAQAEPAVRTWLAADPDNPHAQGALAQALYGLGRFEEAGIAYARVGDAGFMPGLNFYNAACSYARVGRKERALELLAKAVQTGMMPDRASIRADRDFESLRGDPRFEALIVGAPPAGEPGSLL